MPFTPKQKKEINEGIDSSIECSDSLKNKTKELDKCHKDLHQLEPLKNQTKAFKAYQKEHNKIIKLLCDAEENRAYAEEHLLKITKQKSVIKFSKAVAKLCPDLLKENRGIDETTKDGDTEEELTASNASEPPAPSKIGDSHVETTSLASEHVAPPPVSAAGDLEPVEGNEDL